MDISVRSTAYQFEDHSWLGSAHGTSTARTITLDVSAFTAGTHYPNGYIPSGMVLGKITSGGLHGPYTGSVNEVKTATITGAPTGGTFTLTFDAITTAAIAYNATAADVKAALEATAVFSPGDVTVTGSAGGPYTITFGGRYLGLNVPAMTASGASLTGGTSPGVTMATTTEGGSTASNGLEVARGHLLTSIQILSATTVDTGAALLSIGVVREANLPTNHGLDATAKAQLSRIEYR